MSLKTKIKALAKEHLSDVIAIRRHIHANPELSFQETETGRYIANQLAEMGIEYEHGIAENGVVGLIKGKNADKKTVALRADFDALPIHEENHDLAYKSQNKGVMHACGHDAHTASLLGTARILNALKDDLEGTIKLVFQPAEEKLPGGASLMIKEGVLENPTPDVMIGQHVTPPLPSGHIGIKGGIFMASADEIYVTVRGKGGHGANPQDAIDPVLITAHLITALQQIVSRHAIPAMPSVLTFGKVIANGATNIIPDEVYLEGTFRTFDEQWRDKAHQRMIAIAKGLVEGMGGTVDFRIDKGYPVLKNDEALAARTRDYAVAFLGEDKVVDLPIRTTAEDFAYYTQAVPSVFYRIGTGKDADTRHALHTSKFNIDEAALETGMGFMAWIAVNELAR